MRSAKGVVRAADIPALARTSFPLCMRAMYEAVHADHHLRHSGRMELGLFLKVACSLAWDAGLQGAPRCMRNSSCGLGFPCLRDAM